MSKDLVPKSAKDLMEIPKDKTSINPIYDDRQLQRLFKRTPEEHIGWLEKGGTKFPFVKGGYVRRELDVLFGFNWSFEVIEQGEKHGEIIVLGKLTGFVGDKSISKMQAGSAKIKFKKDGKTILDYGNDVKAAITDSLKKCAADFGIARDVYYATEFVEAKIIEEEVKKEAELDKENEDLAELTRELDENEKQAIVADLENLTPTTRMRIVKKVTGKIKLDKDVSDEKLRQIREAIKEEK